MIKPITPQEVTALKLEPQRNVKNNTLFDTAAPTATAMDVNSVGAWGTGEIHYCPKCRFGVFSCEHDKATA